MKDLAEIPDNIKGKLDIKPVKWIDEVLELALKQMPQPVAAPGDAKPAEDGKRAAPKRPAKRAGSKVHAH